MFFLVQKINSRFLTSFQLCKNLNSRHCETVPQFLDVAIFFFSFERIGFIYDLENLPFFHVPFFARFLFFVKLLFFTIVDVFVMQNQKNITV